MEPLVLLVDDDPLVRLGLKNLLTAEGCAVVEAASGEEALQQLGTIRPDVIILDQRLPGLAGLDVARRLRDDPATAGIPIILHSGEGSLAPTEGLVDLVLPKGGSYTPLFQWIRQLSARG